jgi:hypothetical protein
MKSAYIPPQGIIFQYTDPWKRKKRKGGNGKSKKERGTKRGKS